MSNNLFANIKSFVANKKEAKPLSPKQAASVYADKLEASASVKGEAERLMRQGVTTQRAVKDNLDKAAARKEAEVKDQNALAKLMTDLEGIATEVIVNQEKTKVLHSEATALEESNKEVISQLASVSFSTMIASTKAAQNKPQTPQVVPKVQM